MNTAYRWSLLAALLIAGCTAGRFYDQVDVGDNRQIRKGMSADEIAKVMGKPDSVWSGGARRYRNLFGSAGAGIEAGWDEWVWDRGWLYVAYVSAGTVHRVGVVRESPPPSES